MMRVNPPTGQDLREERERRHLSQAEAAVQVGVSKRTWQGWELNGAVVPQPRHRRALLAWMTEPDDEVAA